MRLTRRINTPSYPQALSRNPVADSSFFQFNAMIDKNSLRHLSFTFMVSLPFLPD